MAWKECVAPRAGVSVLRRVGGREYEYVLCSELSRALSLYPLLVLVRRVFCYGVLVLVLAHGHPLGY